MTAAGIVEYLPSSTRTASSTWANANADVITGARS